MKTLDEIIRSGAPGAPILAVQLLAGEFGDKAAQYAMSEIDSGCRDRFVTHRLPVLLGHLGRVDVLRAILDAGPPAWLRLKLSKSMWLARLLREEDDGYCASLYRHITYAHGTGVWGSLATSLLYVACEVYPDHPDVFDLPAHAAATVRRIRRDMMENT